MGWNEERARELVEFGGVYYKPTSAPATAKPRRELDPERQGACECAAAAAAAAAAPAAAALLIFVLSLRFFLPLLRVFLFVFYVCVLSQAFSYCFGLDRLCMCFSAWDRGLTLGHAIVIICTCNFLTPLFFAGKIRGVFSYIYARNLPPTLCFSATLLQLAYTTAVRSTKELPDLHTLQHVLRAVTAASLRVVKPKQKQ